VENKEYKVARPVLSFVDPHLGIQGLSIHIRCRTYIYILYTNVKINCTVFQYAVQNTENHETHNTEEKDKTI
jgi:hypothetical protein